MDRFIEPILDPKYKILEKTTAATPHLRITGSALISPLLSFLSLFPKETRTGGPANALGSCLLCGFLTQLLSSAAPSWAYSGLSLSAHEDFFYPFPVPDGSSVPSPATSIDKVGQLPSIPFPAICIRMIGSDPVTRAHMHHA